MYIALSQLTLLCFSPEPSFIFCENAIFSAIQEMFDIVFLRSIFAHLGPRRFGVSLLITLC